MFLRILGAFFILGGLGLCITIIFFLHGILLMLVGLLFVIVGRGKRQVVVQVPQPLEK